RSLTMRCRFVHGVYQNIIYDSLTPNRRVGLSATVAQALLDSYKEDHGRIAAQLALLFEAARDFSRAVQFFSAAAQHAAAVFAYQETLLLARRGLALLKGLPDAPAKFQAELSLTSTLAVPLSALRGWADPELEEACSRALQLCQMAE